MFTFFKEAARPGGEERQQARGLSPQPRGGGAVCHGVHIPHAVAPGGAHAHRPHGVGGPVARPHPLHLALPRPVVPVHQILHGERVRRGSKRQGLLEMLMKARKTDNG